MANEVRNNVTVNNTKVEETKVTQAPEATQEAAKAEETQQENPAPVEGQEQLPAAVPEVKKGLRFKTKEEKAAEKAARKAERLERSNALRADGHVIKGAFVDLFGALADAAKTAGKVTLGVVAVGGATVGVVALANHNKKEEESGENPGESKERIIDDPVDDIEEVTSEESEANES